MKNIEVRGVRCTFDEMALLDLDTVTWLGELDDGRPFHLKALMNALFCDSMDAVLEHLGKDGRVSVVDAAQFVADAIERAGQGE